MLGKRKGTEDQEDSEETDDSADNNVEEIQIEITDDETEWPAKKKVKKRVNTSKKRESKSGVAPYRCMFKREWTEEWPFITEGTTTACFMCTICRIENSCAHQGRADISRHVKGKRHRFKAQVVAATASIAPCPGPATVGDVKTQEIKMLDEKTEHTDLPVTAPPYAPPENENAEGTEETEDQEESEETDDSMDDGVEEIQIEITEDETEEPEVKTLKKRVNARRKRKSKSGAATYKSAFKKEWTEEWPFITQGTTTSYFWCAICRHEIGCAHQGKSDVRRHVQSKGHRCKAQLKPSASTAPYPGPVTVGDMKAQEFKTRRAEVKVAVSMVQHNVPFAVADHFSPLIKECFPDSPTAQSFKSACTKMSCIINEAVAPHFRKELVKKMRTNPFTLITVRSNDTGRERMNPLTVRLYDSDLKKVIHRFLDMCPTSGPNCHTAEAIYEKMDEALQKNAIPWRNCVSVSVDNAPVDTEVRNSIASRIYQEHSSIYIHECPCQIIHNTAEQAGLAFMEVCGFDLSDLAVDVGFWLKGITDREDYLSEFCELHGSEYMEMLLQFNVRWLSLEKCLTRILQQYAPLARYVTSLNDQRPRFRRLIEAFSEPITEVYLLFYQTMFPDFTNFNVLLQREKSCIFLLYEEMRGFILRLLVKFVKRAVLHHQELLEINFKEPSNQLSGEKLAIGLNTRAKLNTLLESGEITRRQVDTFHQAARAFLERAVEYAINKLPMEEPLIKHAMFVAVQQRAVCGAEDAFYFVDRFPELLPYNEPEDIDELNEEFLDYQTMDIDLPEDSEKFDFESFWGKMASMKNKVSGKSRFPRLSHIAKLVLVFPHSNADAERVFSMVGLNKTRTRNGLALEGTLSSIMAVKMANLEPQCFKWEPPASMIKASKSATNTYNMRHVSTPQQHDEDQQTPTT